MLIKDNGSTDNTVEIIDKLINEGLPIHLVDTGNKHELAHDAIDEYDADLVIPLDADEFLYHIDGINPRESLEAMREEVEYQAIWRTYIYEKEPEIELGFLPNNFRLYRNPEMENPDKYERRKKVIVSRYLLKERHADFVEGSHFLVYPDDNRECAYVEIADRLVFAHFPIRSRSQVTIKSILNWTMKWRTPHRASRDGLDSLQAGVLFNDIKESGSLSPDKLKQHSIEYAMFRDTRNIYEIVSTSREELDKIKNDLGDSLEVTGPMNVSFCNDKLSLLYTDYCEDREILIRVMLEEIDDTVSYLSSESFENARFLSAQVQQVNDLEQHNYTLTEQNDALTEQNDALTKRCDTISLQNDALNLQVSTLSKEIADILSSNTWKIGKRLNKLYRIVIPYKGKRL